MPIRNDDGSITVSLKELVRMFAVSRFNRDPYYPVGENEDIDNSRVHRLYNQGDVYELMRIFVEFFEWTLTTKDIKTVVFCNDFSLKKIKKMPHLKKANTIDEKWAPDKARNGYYYITNGYYSWKFEFRGAFMDAVMEAQDNDPAFLKMKEELIPEMEKRNAEIESKNKSSE